MNEPMGINGPVVSITLPDRYVTFRTFVLMAARALLINVEGSKPEVMNLSPRQQYLSVSSNKICFDPDRNLTN